MFYMVSVVIRDQDLHTMYCKHLRLLEGYLSIGDRRPVSAGLTRINKLDASSSRCLSCKMSTINIQRDSTICLISISFSVV